MANTDPDPFEVRFSPGKGFGNFATRPITAGSVVLMEKPAWIVEGELTMSTVMDTFEPLDRNVKDKIAKLYSRDTPERVEYCQNALRSGFFSADQVYYYTHIHGVISANCFDIPIITEDEEPKMGVCIQASRFNHSCDPNLSYSLDWKPGWWIARAKRDIATDEELFINYLSIVTPGPQRRTILKEEWGFDCSCPPCTNAQATTDNQSRDAVGDIRTSKLVEMTGPATSRPREKKPITTSGHDGNAEDQAQFDKFKDRINHLRSADSKAALFWVYVDAAEWCFWRYDHSHTLQLSRATINQFARDAVHYQYRAMVTGKSVWGDTDALVVEANVLLKEYREAIITQLGAVPP